MSKPVITEYIRWGLRWRSQNQAQELSEYICWYGDIPALFRTREVARDFRENQYGEYTRNRGWTRPSVIKIRVTLKEIL